jgi:iron(III) transport system ATP-binding protein
VAAPHRRRQRRLRVQAAPAWRLPNRSAAQAALDQLGLGHLAERFPHQLSGGQQQRVAIARSSTTRLILLDEPLSNLDAKLREEARVAARTDRVARAVGVCVTHDQTEAMAMSDRILLPATAASSRKGTPAELYGAPRSLYTAEFMGSNNRIDARSRPSTASA